MQNSGHEVWSHCLTFGTPVFTVPRRCLNYMPPVDLLILIIFGKVLVFMKMYSALGPSRPLRLRIIISPPPIFICFAQVRNQVSVPHTQTRYIIFLFCSLTFEKEKCCLISISHTLSACCCWYIVRPTYRLYPIMCIYIGRAKYTLLAKCVYIVFGYLVLDKYSLCANHYYKWLALNICSFHTACSSLVH